MEGQNLYNLVVGQVYNSELRSKLAQFGLRRIGNNQWISKETAAKYELLFADQEEQKIVSGVDLIEKNQHIHINVGPDPVPEVPVVEVSAPIVAVHHRTAMALQRQQEIANSFFDLIDEWNDEMYRQTPLGRQLSTVVKGPQLAWERFMFLPNPLATGDYLFGAIHEGKAASLHAWLELPDGRYIVPTDGTRDGAYDSLQSGIEFHAWEFEQFDTPAAAGQYTIKLLNVSKTTYAQSVRKLLGKENSPVSRNDFYRNASGEMCRIEVIPTEQGLRFNEVPVVPTVADCLESLLSPYIKSFALSTQA